MMTSRVGDIENKTSRNVSKYPDFWKNLSEYFSEYSQQTAIHGVRYVGSKVLSSVERLWWLFTLCVSIMLCSILIVKTYQKWESSPVIVSFAKTSTPLWKIPFPAVTICPETKALQRVYNYTEMYHKLHRVNRSGTDEELKQFDQISLLCNNFPYDNGSKIIDFDTVDLFAKVAPNFTDTLWMCSWLNQNETCGTLFFPTLTDDGVCYTFNMPSREDLFTDEVYHYGMYSHHHLKSIDWNLDGGYTTVVRDSTYPRRALAAGHKGNFGVVLRLYEQDLDYLCKGRAQGFKIHMHNPLEIPTMSQQYFWAPIDTNVVVSITPQMMTTSDGLKKYNSKIRGCYFANERQLKYFKVYTQRNCELECLTNYTLKACDCVAFYMPHNKTTKICGPGSTACMEDAHNAVVQRQEKLKVDHAENGLNTKHLERCDCLPSCTSLSYNVESSYADFNWQKSFEAFKANFCEFPGVRLARIDFSFKMDYFIPSERNELFGVTDFLSHCGGLFGIFIGFSLLSLLEILYFLTLRLMCNIAMYGRHFWSGSTVLLTIEFQETMNRY